MSSSRRPRRHDFFFSPRDYLNDPVVLEMTTMERGAYSTLLFALWDQPEPGVCQDSERTLRALSRTTPEEWAEVRPQVAKAFDLEARPGSWVQKRMVAEHSRQDRYHSSRSRIGKAARAKQLTARGRPEAGSTPALSPSSPSSPAEDRVRRRGPERLGAVLPGILETVGFQPDQVQAKLKSRGLTGANAQRYFKLAGWFWKTGTRDMRVLLFLLEDAIDKQPENWFAYYANDQPARLGVETTARERLAAEDKARWAREDSGVLGRIQSSGDEPG